LANVVSFQGAFHASSSWIATTLLARSSVPSMGEG